MARSSAGEYVVQTGGQISQSEGHGFGQTPRAQAWAQRLLPLYSAKSAIAQVSALRLERKHHAVRLALCWGTCLVH